MVVEACLLLHSIVQTDSPLGTQVEPRRLQAVELGASLKGSKTVFPQLVSKAVFRL